MRAGQAACELAQHKLHHLSFEGSPVSAEGTVNHAANLPIRLKNVAASASAVGLACAIYAIAPHNAVLLDRLHGTTEYWFRGRQFLLAAALAYVLALSLYYLVVRSPGVSKSLRFFAVCARFLRSPAGVYREGLTPTDRLAVLTTLLKGFFGPMMVMWLMGHVSAAFANGWTIFAEGALNLAPMEIFNRHGFWLTIQLILVVDLGLFTVGYLVEMPRLNNEIRSVDPTLLGWAAALLCYPPFNAVTGMILGSNVSDFPRFDDPTAHLALNLLLLALMAVYSSASVFLGLKASNLTHRGIVARGPYALVRHPAYACKNMAWWIGSAPLVSVAFSQSLFTGITAIASVVGWTMLYVLRALTEEDHLRSVDGDYAAYAARVRYRFIPGLV